MRRGHTGGEGKSESMGVQGVMRNGIHADLRKCSITLYSIRQCMCNFKNNVDYYTLYEL